MNTSLRSARWAGRAIVLCLGYFAATAAGQTYDVVHSFRNAGSPYAGLIQGSDGNVYGTTRQGGVNFAGSVFKINSAGNVTTLHSFAWDDGAFPEAGLLLATDGKFYGTTSQGGADNVGTVFKMSSSGELSVVHSFTGPDGANPRAALIQTADGSLWGTTSSGGVGGGTVFKIDTAGSLTVLHTFVGQSPYAPLVRALDGYFYGTTIMFLCSSVSPSCGTVFKIDTTGNFATVHNFTSLAGWNPRAPLIKDPDGNLYGTTTSHLRRVCITSGFCRNRCNFFQCQRFVNVPGNVFKIGPAGDFTIIHTFLPSEGTQPYGGLIRASDGSFYGTMFTAGPTSGTIYKIDSSGALTTLHSFTGPDGANPLGALIQVSNGDFFGTTSAGGSGGVGTVFKIDSAGTVTTLSSFGGAEGSAPIAALLQAADGKLYGTTFQGGASNLGTVFKVDALGSFSTVHSSTGADGSSPYGALIQDGSGNLYGTTYDGGANGNGSIFKLGSSGSLTTLYSFSGSDGANPYAGLLRDGSGNLYGTTVNGGAGYGIVFELDTTGTPTTLYSFSGSDGANPYAGLLRDGSGNLYGTTANGGVNGFGTVFKLDTTGTPTWLYSFSASDGATPYAALIRDGSGNLFGTTLSGGENGMGTVFKLDTSGLPTGLHSFAGSDGASPLAALIRDGSGNLYGTTRDGGTQNSGTIFELDTSGTPTTLHSFNGAGGANPNAPLVQDGLGSLYGTAQNGGWDGRGVVFRLIFGSATLDVTGVEPSSGSAQGGSLRVSGKGFQTGARVMIGDAPAPVASVLTATAPATAIKTYTLALSPGTLNDVTVINPNASFGVGKGLWLADFRDVPRWDSLHDYVEKIFRRGITVGYGNGYFGRDDPVMRAQMAVFLLKAKRGQGYVPPACTGVFADVACSPQPAFAADFIEELYHEGITQGCSTDPLQYCPERPVTRAEASVLLLRAEHGSGYAPPACTGVFADVACLPTPDFAVTWIEQLYREGVTKGCLGNPVEYCPGISTARGQMAVFLVRTFGLQ